MSTHRTDAVERILASIPDLGPSGLDGIAAPRRRIRLPRYAEDWDEEEDCDLAELEDEHDIALVPDLASLWADVAPELPSHVLLDFYWASHPGASGGLVVRSYDLSNGRIVYVHESDWEEGDPLIAVGEGPAEVIDDRLVEALLESNGECFGICLFGSVPDQMRVLHGSTPRARLVGLIVDGLAKAAREGTFEWDEVDFEGASDDDSGPLDEAESEYQRMWRLRHEFVDRLVDLTRPEPIAPSVRPGA